MADERSEHRVDPPPPASRAADRPAVGPLLADAVGKVLATLLERGRAQAESVARWGRQQLEVRQARKDLNSLARKLGWEVVALVEAGEVDHPGVRRRVEQIRAQERAVADAVAALEALGGRAEPDPEASEAGAVP